MRRTPEENKKLCEEMPFIRLTNRWTGQPLDDDDYRITELDAAEIPRGWEELFFNFCKELSEIASDKYRFLQVKEKYGSLRIYAEGHLKKGHEYEEYNKLEDKYVELSKHTCCRCGSPDAKMRYDAWICPWCDDCYDKKGRK